MASVKSNRPSAWTKREDDFLREHYPNEKTENIAYAIHRTYSAVKSRATFLGLKKSVGFWRDHGVYLNTLEASKKTRFKTGNTPRNKGKKYCEYVSPETIEKYKRVQFKPGNTPANFLPVGSESMKNGYVTIKPEGSRRMVYKHIWVWEQHHGKRPKGYFITFKDGDRSNCDISNLILLSSSEFARLKMQRMAPEQRQAASMKALETRKELIRKDKMRIRWGLEPKTKLVKKWYAPQM